jgi:two-component system cell cycle sensor histidine kinase/response regulator CckA
LGYSRGTETILLVEDEELLRHLVAEMLSDLGYRVLSASSGTEALAMAPNVSGEIHVLITDVLMPEMDGTKLAESLRSQRPSLKVLFVTGDTTEACPSSPGMSRLNKPFTIKMLAEKVRELLKD